jgi:syntaxin 1B/2/3
MATRNRLAELLAGNKEQAAAPVRHDSVAIEIKTFSPKEENAARRGSSSKSKTKPAKTAKGPDDLKEVKEMKPLKPLKSASAASASASSSSALDPLRRYKVLLPTLHQIESATADIQRLTKADSHAASPAARREIQKQVDALVGPTTAAAMEYKNALVEISTENKAYRELHGNTAMTQIRFNSWTQHTRKFQETMKMYNEAIMGFKSQLRMRTKSLIRQVDPALSEEQLDSMVDSHIDPQQLVSKALLSENVLEEVKNIEARHVVLLELEKQVMEVAELFRDLQVLVELQQESLDVISKNIEKTKVNTEKGEENIVQAKRWQDKVRNWFSPWNCICASPLE